MVNRYPWLERLRYHNDEMLEDRMAELDQARDERVRRGKRAERRYHYRRLKKKRATYWGGSECSPRHAGIKVSAPKPHSTCSCCCNERHIEGPTRHEREHALALREQQDD